MGFTEFLREGNITGKKSVAETPIAVAGSLVTFQPPPVLKSVASHHTCLMLNFGEFLSKGILKEKGSVGETLIAVVGLMDTSQSSSMLVFTDASIGMDDIQMDAQPYQALPIPWCLSSALLVYSWLFFHHPAAMMVVFPCSRNTLFILFSLEVLAVTSRLFPSM